MIRLVPALLVAIALLPAEINMRVFHVASGQNTRVNDVDERTFAHGSARIRFGQAPGAIGVTCAATSCNVIDVVAGRRAHSRAFANGRDANVSLRGNTLITTARD